MARKVNSNPDETRAHILEVARQEFFRTGYAGASINAIVEATNFTKPTVYYHFENKAELFAALIHDAYDRCYEHRVAAVNVNAPAAEQIRQAIAADFDFCVSSPDEVRFVIAYTFALPDEQPVDLTEIHRRDYQFFCDLIERGVKRGELRCPDPTEVALSLQGIIVINIMSYLKMNHAPEFLSKQRAREIVRLLLKGIEKLPRTNKTNTRHSNKRGLQK